MRLHRRVGSPTPLRHFVKLAGLEEVLEESCGKDVEDELATELDDNPRTTESFSHVSCGFLPTGPLT